MWLVCTVLWVHITVICTVHTQSQKQDSEEKDLCKCDWCTVLWVHITAIWVRSKPLWGRRPLSSLPVFLYSSMIGQLIPLLHHLFTESTKASFILIDKNTKGLSRKSALVWIIKNPTNFLSETKFFKLRPRERELNGNKLPEINGRHSLYGHF